MEQTVGTVADVAADAALHERRLGHLVQRRRIIHEQRLCDE